MKVKSLKFLSTLLVFTLLLSMLCISAVGVSAQTNSEDSGSSDPAVLYGDVDSDGKIATADVLMIQKHLAALITLTDAQATAADVDADKHVTVQDVLLVQKYLAQIIDSFPAASAPADASWARNKITYEIFVRSFYDSDGDGIGDLRGVAEKVDYLKSLNVGTVWLMPIMDSTTYHGYDVVDYQKVNPDYGTMEDFEYMLKVLHDNGIKVILDYVANHTSSSNAWFKQALADANSKYRNYYFISEEAKTENGWRQAENGLYYYGLYDSIMPDLNYNNQDVRDDIKAAAGFWLDKGIDGFRLDGANNIDEDPNVTHSWWQEFTTYVKAKNPAAFIVGENWESTMEKIAPYYADMDSSFNFDAANLLEEMARGVQTDIVKKLNEGHALYAESANTTPNVPKATTDSIMINNHDMERIASRVGSKEQAKLAAALQFTLPGTPYIYYGDELGQLGEKPDDNRREPMDWYASAQGEGMTQMTGDKWMSPMKYTLPDDGISYEEQKDDANSIYSYYKKLTEIRTLNPMLYTGQYGSVGMNDGLYTYTVSEDGVNEKLFVAHNLTGQTKKLTLDYDAVDLISGAKIAAGNEAIFAPYASLVIKYTGDHIPAKVPYNPPTEAETKEYTLTLKMTLPENTPEDEPIYVVGTFNNWTVADPPYELTRTSKTTAEITFKTEGTVGKQMQYKFNRGTWDKREQGADGADLIGDLHKENRYYEFTQDAVVTINGTIEKWSDIN